MGCLGELGVSASVPSILSWSFTSSSVDPLGEGCQLVSLGLAGTRWDPQHGSSAPTGMRILVTLLLDTLPMLGNVLLLCFFVFFIFGIVGVQLWAGLLRNRCFLPENFSL